MILMSDTVIILLTSTNWSESFFYLLFRYFLQLVNAVLNSIADVRLRSGGHFVRSLMDKGRVFRRVAHIYRVGRGAFYLEVHIPH